MKKILAFAVLICLPMLARAGGSAANIAVMESSVTVNVVSVASGTAVDVTALSASMPDRTTLVIQNLDTTSNIFCGGAGVTTTTGFMVAPGGSISINVRPYSQALAQPIRFFCISASTTGATLAAVIKGY